MTSDGHELLGQVNTHSALRILPLVHAPVPLVIGSHVGAHHMQQLVLGFPVVLASEHKTDHTVFMVFVFTLHQLRGHHKQAPSMKAACIPYHSKEDSCNQPITGQCNMMLAELGMYGQAGCRGLDSPVGQQHGCTPHPEQAVWNQHGTLIAKVPVLGDVLSADYQRSAVWVDLRSEQSNQQPGKHIVWTECSAQAKPNAQGMLAHTSMQHLCNS